MCANGASVGIVGKLLFPVGPLEETHASVASAGSFLVRRVHVNKLSTGFGRSVFVHLEEEIRGLRPGPLVKCIKMRRAKQGFSEVKLMLQACFLDTLCVFILNIASGVQSWKSRQVLWACFPGDASLQTFLQDMGSLENFAKECNRWKWSWHWNRWDFRFRRKQGHWRESWPRLKTNSWGEKQLDRVLCCKKEKQLGRHGKSAVKGA